MYPVRQDNDNQHETPYSLPQKLTHGDFSQLGTSQRYALVVVPTYNEALNIEPLLAAILAQGPEFDVLVIDDNSPDCTGNIVADIGRQTPRIQLQNRPAKLGLGTAYLSGFRQALQQGYSFIIQMDADFSHQPHYLPILLMIAERDADIAIGSRNVPGARVENWSWRRHVLSKGGNTYARLVCGLPVHDCTGGFKCFRAGVLRTIDLDAIESNGYGFQVEMNHTCARAGFRMVEYPIIFPDRIAGQSKMSGSIIREAALMVWRLRLKARRQGQVAPVRSNGPSSSVPWPFTAHEAGSGTATGPGRDGGGSEQSNGKVQLSHLS